MYYVFDGLELLGAIKSFIGDPITIDNLVEIGTIKSRPNMFIYDTNGIGDQSWATVDSYGSRNWGIPIDEVPKELRTLVLIMGI